MLDYNLDDRGSLTLYEYIYQRIRDDIVDGSIAADEHLPSKRALADHLGISVITIENAYSQLVAEGYVYTRPRRGFYARALPEAPAMLPRRDDGERDTYLPAAELAGVSDDVAPAPLSPSALEAARLWQRTLRAVMASEDEREIFAPAPAQGTLRLRRAIAHHLRGSRGMDVDPANIVIGAGAQLLDTMLVQLLGQDRVYAVEDPGYLRLTHIYRAMGCEVRHIPLDDEGVSLAALRTAEADVLHLMPSHQYPTGLVTSIARRYALLSWAAERPGRYLIEDDFDCEFRLAGRPVPPLMSIDATGSVIYTNTFSKSLSAALRLAYMVLPADLMERYDRELGFYASSVSSIDQIALARLLESGEYERHVSRVRKRAREARDRLVDAVQNVFPHGDVQIDHADAGLFCVLKVNDSVDAERLVGSLRKTGLSCAGIEPFDRGTGAFEGSDIRRYMVQYEELAAIDADSLRLALLRSSLETK